MRQVSFVLLIGFSALACRGGANGVIASAEPVATIVEVPGRGAMRCVPVASASPALLAGPVDSSQAMPMDLPRGASDGPEVISVELNAKGDTSLDGKVVGDSVFLERARAATNGHSGLRAVLRVDQTVPYGQVIHVVDLLKRAGVPKIAFAVTPTPTPSSSAP